MMKIKAKKRTGLGIIGGIIGLIVVVLVAGMLWYTSALKPVDTTDVARERFDVEKGLSTEQIANDLQQQGFIRNSFAYQIHAKLSSSGVQAGTHMISPSLSSQEIAKKLSMAETDEISVTIPPGLMLGELRDVFKKYGYSDAEITAAYGKKYTNAVLADKPASADLEGYIFPETYNVFATDDLSILLSKSFDELERRLQADDAFAKFENNGLSTFEAVTLASIVQQEVPDPVDQKKVAGVFYNRLADNSWLGSDATFVFAAKKLGVTPSPMLDSPYNTRLYKGLPPGPIANMNFSALAAVADPIRSDYNYFVSGDDGTTYFAVTEAEHLENVAKFCTKLCQ